MPNGSVSSCSIRARALKNPETRGVRLNARRVAHQEESILLISWLNGLALSRRVNQQMIETTFPEQPESARLANDLEIESEREYPDSRPLRRTVESVRTTRETDI